MRSIRARVTAAFLLLITMAAIEAIFVLYVQRQSVTTFDEVVRTEAILADHAALQASLFGMQASQRGYVIASEPRELVARAGMRADYERLAAQVRPLLRDPRQRAQFARIETLVADWEEASQDLIARHERRENVAALIVESTGPKFDVIRRELAAFQERQRSLTRAAIALGDSHIRRTTYALAAIPLVAIVFMVGLLAATQRTLLHPLAEVARTARRLGRGDYEAPLPPGRGDEIGTLVDAFAEMRGAVQARAADAAAAHRQVRSANAELLAVINTAPSGLVVMDHDGGIRLQNRAAEHLLGGAPADVETRKRYWQTFVVRDTSGRAVRLRDLPPVRALGGIEVVGEELNVERPDGRQAEILLGASPLRDESGRITGAVAGFQDITRLRELDRMKDEFVAIVSHELRTPLTAIRGSLQLLLVDNACPDAEQRELLAVAASSCERLVRIVNDMLDLSKIEAGRLELRLATLSVATLTGQAVDGVAVLARAANVRIAIDVDPSVPAIRGDADRLTQALVNLLSNALKFAPSGSQIAVTARLEDAWVALRVADQGHGIAAADLPRLFHKFEQLDSAGTRRTGGTGLGLVITKAIVEQHGGTIAVASSPTGTTFTIRLRADVAQDSAATASTAPDAALPLAADGTPRRTILIAEDDADTRTVLRKTLERHGFHVLEAADGAEALGIASQTTLDALLLDLRMPRVHGHDVIRALRKLDATTNLPIVVLSGSENERHSLQSLMLGANVFIVKPANPDALVAEFLRLLDRDPGCR